MPPAPPPAPAPAPPPAPAPQSFATPKNPNSSSGGSPSLKELVIRAKEEGVSDLHLGVNEFPRFRNRGEIADIGYPPTDLDTFFGWLRECMSDEEIEIFQKTLDFDGAFDFGFVRIRISCMDSLRPGDGAATNSCQNTDNGGIETAGGI